MEPLHLLLVRSQPSLLPDAAVKKGIARKEILSHCHRRTRATDEMVSALEELLLSLSGATNTLGVPLLKEEMKMIWQEQKQHVACLTL